MPKRDEHDLARDLLAKAKADLEALLVLSESDVDDSILGFHAQQAIEKSLKAVLSAHAAEYERTHDLEYLIELLGERSVSLPIGAEELGSMTQWAVRFRYETDVPRLDRQQALSLARTVHGWALAALADLRS